MQRQAVKLFVPSLSTAPAGMLPIATDSVSEPSVSTSEAATLRGYWEQKVNYFVTGNPSLFGSEYAFDSTGFESTAAFARYAASFLIWMAPFTSATACSPALWNLSNISKNKACPTFS